MWIFSSLINSFINCIIDQCYVCQSPIKFSTYTLPYVMPLLTIRLAYDLFHLFPFFYWTWKNINHYVVFLVQRQQFWHIIFWWGLTTTKDFQDSIFACESSLPYSNHSGIACMINIVIVKLQKISLSKPNVKLPLGMI